MQGAIYQIYILEWNTCGHIVLNLLDSIFCIWAEAWLWRLLIKLQLKQVLLGVHFNKHSQHLEDLFLSHLKVFFGLYVVTTRDTDCSFFQIQDLVDDSQQWKVRQ